MVDPTFPDSPISRKSSVIDRHDTYMTLNYGRYPIVMQRGKGCQLWDEAENRYLDLFSGFGAGVLGHCHPDLVRALTEQASQLWHVGNLLHTEPQTRLAEAIARHGFEGRSYFCHSGADANEAALKLARLYGQSPDPEVPNASRYKVITALQSFHGRSFGTMPATGQQKVSQGFEPLTPGYTHIPYNDLDAAARAVDAQTVAIMVEPIQGEGGVVVPDDDYLPGLRALCDKHDLLLIFDEVWTGCGRTGCYFAYQHWPVTPDIMTLAKGVGGGLAVGVMCAHSRVADLFDHRTQGRVVHASTLGGNCLGMAVGAAVFEVLQRDNLVTHAQQMGQYVLARLEAFARRCPDAGIVGLRGKGLFLGIELDIQSSVTWYHKVSDVVDRCLQQGVLVNGTQNNILRLAPPLVVSEVELDQGLEVLEGVLAGEARNANQG